MMTLGLGMLAGAAGLAGILYFREGAYLRGALCWYAGFCALGDIRS